MITRAEALELYRKIVLAGCDMPATGRSIEQFAVAICKLQSEKIQHDIITVMDGCPQELINSVCDVVVKHSKQINTSLT